MKVTDMSLDKDTVKNLNNLTPEQHRKVRNIIRWQRIGCIVVKISETLGCLWRRLLICFTGARPAGGFTMRRRDFIFRETCMSWMISWRRFLHRHNRLCPKIKNAPQVCCLAARLGGLLCRFRCVDNKNPDSSPVSVIWERDYRACILQQRYTFCFNPLIIYRVSVPGTICPPHRIPNWPSAKT